MIKSRLEHWLENKNLLPKLQFGFRKGSSTLDNLASLISDIQIGFSRNESTSVLFLDITGAYDNVDCNILEK